MKYLLLLILKFYQYLISPFLGRNCRFSPTCSCYAKECLEHFPVHIALWYSLVRIFKCHPFHSGGYDPIPTKTCVETCQVDNEKVSSRCTNHLKEV